MLLDANIEFNLAQSRLCAIKQNSAQKWGINMKQKLLQFMQGRYGADHLARFLLGCSLTAIILDLFFRNNFFSLLTILFLALSYFRILSKNIQKRSAENQKYLQYTYRLRCYFYKLKTQTEQRRHYHIYKCPSCHQKIRIPRGKGKIVVACPKCHAEFTRRS